MKLLSDRYALNDKKKLYAKAGEEVTLIKDNGNVLIVASKKGERFPVRKEEVEF